jgi:hypothetical protein
VNGSGCVTQFNEQAVVFVDRSIEIERDDGLRPVRRIDLRGRFGLEDSHVESPGLWGGCAPIIKQLFSISTDP